MPNYTPYTYPHPLVSTEAPPPPQTQWQVVITSTSDGTTTPTGVQNVDSGMSLIVTAIPAANYTLQGWVFDGAGYGNAQSVTIPSQTDGSMHSLEAVFGSSTIEPPSLVGKISLPLYAAIAIVGIEGYYRWTRKED